MTRIFQTTAQRRPGHAAKRRLDGSDARYLRVRAERKYNRDMQHLLKWLWLRQHGVTHDQDGIALPDLFDLFPRKKGGA